MNVHAQIETAADATWQQVAETSGPRLLALVPDLRQSLAAELGSDMHPEDVLTYRVITPAIFKALLSSMTKGTALGEVVSELTLSLRNDIKAWATQAYQSNLVLPLLKQHGKVVRSARAYVQELDVSLVELGIGCDLLQSFRNIVAAVADMVEEDLQRNPRYEVVGKATEAVLDELEFILQAIPDDEADALCGHVEAFLVPMARSMAQTNKAILRGEQGFNGARKGRQAINQTELERREADQQAVVAEQAQALYGAEHPAGVLAEMLAEMPTQVVDHIIEAANALEERRVAELRAADDAVLGGLPDRRIRKVNQAIADGDSDDEILEDISGISEEQVAVLRKPVEMPLDFGTLVSEAQGLMATVKARPGGTPAVAATDSEARDTVPARHRVAKVRSTGAPRKPSSVTRRGRPVAQAPTFGRDGDLDRVAQAADDTGSHVDPASVIPNPQLVEDIRKMQQGSDPDLEPGLMSDFETDLAEAVSSSSKRRRIGLVRRGQALAAVALLGFCAIGGLYIYANMGV